MRPNLESLETRQTPAAFYDGDGNIVVTGQNVYVNTNDPNDVLIVVGGVKEPGTWVASPGTRVIIDGTAGNDQLQLSGFVNGEIHGFAGADVIIGGSGDDVIEGGDGNDIIDGGAGNDVSVGGLGADRLRATSGDDVLIGGEPSPSLDYATLRSVGDAWAQSNTVMPLSVNDPHDAPNRDTFYCGSGDDLSYCGSNDLFSSFGAFGSDTKVFV